MVTRLHKFVRLLVTLEAMFELIPHASGKKARAYGNYINAPERC